MYHAIEMVNDFVLANDVNGSHRRGIVIRQGSCLWAETRPYIRRTSRGPIEVADLRLADGTVVRSVPFAAFNFVD